LVRTRARGKSYIEDLATGQQNTVNIGSRNSERLLRIYDQRHLEERQHLTRVELQLMGDQARGFWDKLCTAGFDGFIELALGSITDFVDFVDTTKDSNTTRAPRLEAWSALVGSVSRLSVRRVVAAVRTAETVAAWAFHSVSAILTAAVEAGALTWDEFQREGLTRYRPKHKAIARGLALS
jgi:DNA relaxase NicK